MGEGGESRKEEQVMIPLNCKNVNDAYYHGMHLIRDRGILVETRNGPAFRLGEPVATRYAFPMQRVLFEATRDCNPFFHFFEALWMLQGRNDTAFVGNIVKRMNEFSDDGKTLNGAYGYRWRVWFDYDQIRAAIDVLKKDPSSRRIYIGMWDPSTDLTVQGKDVPCNLGIKLDVFDGVLNMYVTNRSNDIIWGAYGANMVHMSMLHEYIAAATGIPIGAYEQISMDYHAYKDIFAAKMVKLLERGDDWHDPYSGGRIVDPMPMDGVALGSFDKDLRKFFTNGQFIDTCHYETDYFEYTAKPMWRSLMAYQKKDPSLAMARAFEIKAEDWRMACCEWLARRQS